MNVKLLDKVKKEILKEPERFLMDGWSRPIGKGKTCTTAFCIGGWAVALSSKKDLRKASGGFLPTDSAFDYVSTAAKLLRLDPDQAHRLFCSQEWPASYEKIFSMLENEGLVGTDAAAKIAARRIDFFITTNGDDD